MGKRMIFPALLVLSLAMILSGVSVFAKARTSVENRVATGAVKIGITPAESHFENILPGQTLRIRPAISNEGYDCYLRVRYAADILQEHLIMQDIPDGWIKNETDGYWYYKDIVKSGETVTVFKSILVDPQMPQELSEGKRIRLLIDAEAVQAVNFSPDFNGHDPWNGTLPEAFAGNEVNTAAQGLAGSGGLNVVYEGKADKLIADPKDFFANLPVLMPGDVFEQKIGLKNEYAKKISLYFCTKVNSGADLLEKISLKIRADGRLVYHGTLASPQLEGEQNKIRLAEIPANGKGECSFEISVPESLKNEFTLKESSFSWIFLTDDVPRDDPKKTPEVPAGDGQKQYTKRQIDTGDGSKTGSYLMLFGSALLVITAAGRKLGSRRRKET